MLRSAVWLMLGIVIPGALSLAVAQVTDPTQKRVLVLYSVRPDGPAYNILESTYRRALGERLADRLDYYSEVIDAARFDDPQYEAVVVEFLQRKYRDRQIDLLIANGEADVVFAERVRPLLSPQIPIVFNGHALQPPANSTGVAYEVAMKASLDLALTLQPDTRQIFVVGGASEYDRYYENAFREQVDSTSLAASITYLVGLPLHELTETLARLPEKSIIFVTTMSRDGAGGRYIAPDVIERLARVANAPIYCWFEPLMGRGIVGGRLLSVEAVAEKTTELALRVLDDEIPASIPVETIDATVPQVDWRQLRRWGISEARVPPGVEVLFREATLMERYRGYVIGAISIIALQAGLLVGLLLQSRRRLRAEASLRESEARFRVMADTAPVLVWRASDDSDRDFFNRPWLEFRGRTPDQERSSGWLEGVHPEDLDRCLATFTTAFTSRTPFRIEYRLRRADGEYRWILDTGVVRRSPEGAFLGYIGSGLDITDRKRAEEDLRQSESALRGSRDQIQDLAGRLIASQEDERARIARELHDDISQQIAGLSLALSGIKRRPEAQQSEDLQHALSSLQRRTITLVDDIRHLSHDLHPSVLQHGGGLIDAIRSYGSEFSKQYGVAVGVEADGAFDLVDPTMALGLYRITQESLRNVAKHADAGRVDVRISRRGDDMELSIEDDGQGFDLVEARQRGGGLGLRSIEERTRMLGGTVSIDTAPGLGTRVRVRVNAVSLAAADHLANA